MQRMPTGYTFLISLRDTSVEVHAFGISLRIASISVGFKASTGCMDQMRFTLYAEWQCAVRGPGADMQCCWVAGGSGSAYIYGFCDRNWRPGMSEEDCEAFVKKAVGLALSRDGSSGGCIRTVVITKDGVRRSFLPNDKVTPPSHTLPGLQV